MLSPTIRRRHSDAGPIRPADFAALKNTPLPEIPSLGMLKKERDGLACTRAFKEIVNEILAYLHPKESIRLQHLSKTCSKAVENNSTIVKLSEKEIEKMKAWGIPVYTRYTTIPLGWDKDLNEVDLQEVAVIPGQAPSVPDVPWHEILGCEWRADDSSPTISPDSRYLLVAGNVFDSFIIDVQDLSPHPFLSLPPSPWIGLLDMVRSRQINSCFIHLHYAIQDDYMHQRRNHPLNRRSSANHEVHVQAELDPGKPQDWFLAIDACIRYAPELNDVFKYDLDHSLPTKHLRQNKCHYTWSAQQVLVGDVDYTWALSR
ncbi:hypothetical protein PRZ48_008948 [Zasmidium cellare]|uniref:F-box domain-containing protein n=1 Tax=Zasmidium cellare TaxID=395010 RepID=A0ABR0EHZ6_ZASCE|nr:hypothetical protein PRZ48_008948 [Zasmidium cellare]